MTALSVSRPWTVVLIVAVLSRLKSTDGRSLRLHQQHQQLERAGYQNPELYIDRAYQLMNEKRDQKQQHQQQHHPSWLEHAALRPTNGADDDENDNVRPRLQSHSTAAAAAAAGDSSNVVDVTASTTARLLTKTGSAHSTAPKYHYEVHSVQYNPEKFKTPEQKLESVVRQAALAEYNMNIHDDGIRQTLLDDSEQHNQRLMAARKTRTDHSPDQHSLAAQEKYRLEQLRHLEAEQDEEGVDSDIYEDEMLLPQRTDDKQSGKQVESGIPAGSAVVDVRVEQNTADDEKAKVEDDGDQSNEKEGVQENADAVVALPLQSNIDDTNNWMTRNAVGHASSIADIYFLAVVIGCAVAGICGFLFAGLCWYRLHKKVKAASEVDYPAYGVTGPVTAPVVPVKRSSSGGAGSPGDRKLAQSAQMYHYQHQKQQMLASERLGSDVNQHVGGTGSDVESEEENEDGDYTVFECPGLATNGEMEVRNPMFSDPTPVGTPADAPGLYTKK